MFRTRNDLSGNQEEKSDPGKWIHVRSVLLRFYSELSICFWTNNSVFSFQLCAVWVSEKNQKQVHHRSQWTTFLNQPRPNSDGWSQTGDGRSIICSHSTQDCMRTTTFHAPLNPIFSKSKNVKLKSVAQCRSDCWMYYVTQKYWEAIRNETTEPLLGLLTLDPGGLTTSPEHFLQNHDQLSQLFEK